MRRWICDNPDCIGYYRDTVPSPDGMRCMLCNEPQTAIYPPVGKENALASDLDSRHDENVLALLNDYAPIPFRIAQELGITSDCVLGIAGWSCHMRLGVRFRWDN